uniref:Peptidase aspartic putative domain-containing protein n=1 Tax=Anopheles atroparvus TaxID=41427 RepID=A0A182IKV0_ANOAO
MSSSDPASDDPGVDAKSAMQQDERTPAKGPTSLVSGGEERSSNTAAAATIGGVTPRLVRRSPSPTPGTSRSTTLSAATTGGGTPEWVRNCDMAETPQSTTAQVRKDGPTAAQEFRLERAHGETARSVNGVDRKRRQREAMAKRKAILELELQMLELEASEDEEAEEMEQWLRETDRCGAEAPHGDKPQACETAVLFASTGCPPAVSAEKTPGHGRDDWAAFQECRRAIDAKARAAAMADPTKAFATEAGINQHTYSHMIRTNATITPHGLGTAHSADIYGHMASTHASYHGFTAHPGNTAHATHTYNKVHTSKLPQTDHPTNNALPGDSSRDGTFGVTFLSQSQISARQVTNRELPTFSGSPEEWLTFIANYDHSTAICGYSDEENLLRLQRALKGAARQTVGPLLMLPAGLREAMDTLKARYGHPEMIVESMVERVRKLPAPRADKLETLADFGFAVRTLCATVRATGLQEYMFNMALLRELVNKLPPTTRVEWARHKKQLMERRSAEQQWSGVSLSDFGKWIGDLAEDVSGVIPYAPVNVDSKREPDRRTSTGPPRAHQFYPRFPPQHQPYRSENRPAHEPNRGQPSTSYVHTNSHSSAAQPPNPAPGCVLCQGRCASLDRCAKFVAMTAIERRAVINKRKRCKRCLDEHRGKCNFPSLCGVNGCSFQHHPLLHEGIRQQQQESEQVNAHANAADGTVLLKYLPVIVHGPRGQVRTYAFVDEGSTSTLMDHELLAELGLTGTAHPMSLQWTGHVTREEKDSVRVNVRISGTGAVSATHELIDVRTVRELALPAQTLAIPSLARRYLT